METGNNLAEASVVHVPDTQLNSSNSQNYRLLLDIAWQRYSIGLYHTVENTFTSVISRKFTDTGSLIAELQHEPLLRNRYQKVVISLPAANCCCVADELFDEREINTYYNFNFSEEPKGRLYTHKLPAANLHLIYAADSGMRNALDGLFAQPVFISRPGAWLVNLIRDNGPAREDQLFVHLENGSIWVAVLDKGRFHSLNRYDVQAAADVGYYCLAIAERLEMNPAKIKLYYSHEGNDSLLGELPTYFARVAATEPPKAIKYAQALEAVPAEAFYHLYSLSVCAL